MEGRESPVSASPVSRSPPLMPAEQTLGPAAAGGVGFSGGGGSGDLAKTKKRGRPRKYDADGNLNPGYKSPSSAPPAGFCFSPVELPPASKRGRGKHGASRSWQMLAGLGELFANTAGGDFTPHVVTVHTGEDVASKIISFSQNGPRGVCVLSANGTVSNVTIRQPGSSGGLLTYEGRFEILSLKGSYAVSENGGMKCRTGGLSVSLAGSDGRVIGGGLAGLLVAASPIQMVVASFLQTGFAKAQKRKQNYEPRTTPLNPASADTVIPATPISEAAPNINIYPIPAGQVHVQGYREAYNKEAHDSERLQSYGVAHDNETVNNEAHNIDNNNDLNDKHNPNTSSDSGEWNIADPNSGHRPYPDINVSLY